MSSHASPIATYRSSTSALDRRGWNLALAFQEVFTAIVRLRYNLQSASNAESFRAQMKQALRVAEQEARTGGYSSEDVKQAIFAIVALLDESVLSSGNPTFQDWHRLPLQAELFGHQLAGEVFFQELQTTLTRSDSHEVSDLLEVYALCILLGFKGRYAAGGAGDLQALLTTVQQKMQRIRGTTTLLSPRANIPAEAIRFAQSDPWDKKLRVGAALCWGAAVVLWILFKFVLISSSAAVSTLAVR